MDNEMKIKNATLAYETLCAALDDMGWKYNRDDDKLIVNFNATGNDLSTSFVILVDVERQLVRLLGYLPFEMSEDKRVEGSIATNFVNYKFADGNFAYNIGNGRIVFSMTATFLDSLIGKEVFEYMIRCSCDTIDDYNDEFLAISEGKLELSKFIAKHSD